MGRRQRLVRFIVGALVEIESDEGWLTAKDLYWNLKAGDAPEDVFTENEIQDALVALSSPALSVIRSKGTGFKSLGATRISSERLTRLADITADRGTI